MPVKRHGRGFLFFAIVSEHQTGSSVDRFTSLTTRVDL
jgi:hypothetical protein